MTEDEVCMVHSLCVAAQSSPDAAQRAQAEQQLQAYCCLDRLPQLRYLLLSPTAPTTCHTLAGCTLLSLCTQHWGALALEAKLELRNSLLAALQNQAAVAEAERLTPVVDLLCRITKLGWFDHEAFRKLPGEVTESGAFRGSPHVMDIAFKLLIGLVSEVSVRQAHFGVGQQMRVWESFREEVLLGIFRTAMNTLQSMGDDISKADPQVCKRSLCLAHDCLSFHFHGMTEDTDDDRTMHYPRTWLDDLSSPRNIQMLWDLYDNSGPPLSSGALRCLARIACTSPSCFPSHTDYQVFLARLLRPAKAAVSHGTGLADNGNHMQLCHFFACCPSTQQLCDVLCTEGWADHMLRFTTQSFQAWRSTAGSHVFLLKWWQRAVQCGAWLQHHVVEVGETYIRARMEMVRAFILEPGSLEDPLKDMHAMEQLVGMWGKWVSPHLVPVGKFLLSTSEPLLQDLHGHWHLAKNDAAPLHLLERELALLQYFAGALLAQACPADDESLRVYAELAAFNCKLLRDIATIALQAPASPLSTAMSPEQPSAAQLLPGTPLAILATSTLFANHSIFMHCLPNPSAVLLGHLHGGMGTSDASSLFAALANPLLGLVVASQRCCAIMQSALEAIKVLCTKWCLGPIPLLPDAVLLVWNPAEVLRKEAGHACITQFYCALAHLLRPSLSVAEILQNLEVHFSQPSPERASELAQVLMGMLKSCGDVEGFKELWRWVYPGRLASLRASFEMSCAPAPLPMLELAAELAWDAGSGRLDFSPTCSDGIAVFSEVIAWLTPGMRVGIIGARNSDGTIQYAPLATVTMRALARCLQGRFCPLAAMAHYKEPALAQALSLALQCIMGLSTEDRLRDFPLATAYYELTEALCTSHVQWLSTVDSQAFRRLLDSLLEVLSNVELRCISAFSPALLALAQLILHHFQDPSLLSSPGRPLPDTDALFSDLLSPLLHHLCLETCPASAGLAPILITCLMTSPAAKAACRRRVEQGTLESTAHFFGQNFAALLAHAGGDGTGGLAVFLHNLALLRERGASLAAPLLGSIEAIVQRSPTLSPALGPVTIPPFYSPPSVVTTSSPATFALRSPQMQPIPFTL